MKHIFMKSLGLVLGLMLPLVAFSQNLTVKGVVSETNGEPLPGAYVMIKGTTTGVSSGLDGEYVIEAPANAVLVVSYVGYVTEEVPVAGASTHNVALRFDSEALEGTVVIGYGSARKSDVTGSIASMNGNDLRAVPANDISYALSGRVAGIDMTQTSSRPGESMQIRIRGERSVSASNDPLIVLDGIPFMGNLSEISPSNIKSMDILKDAASTAIYGSRGANGVILISTYKGVKGAKPQISYSTYLGAKKAKKYPMMNTEQYMKMRTAAGKFSNSAEESEDNDTDWQDLFFRTGFVRNHELSVSGGTASGNYNFGVNYFKDDAVVPTQDYDRIGFHGNIDQNVGKYITIGFATNTNMSHKHGSQVGLYNILEMTPMTSPYDENKKLKRVVKMPSDDVYIYTKESLEALGDRYINESFGLGTYNNGYLEVKAPWIEGLSYKLSASLNYRTNKTGHYTGVGVNATNEAEPNSASFKRDETVNWTVENLLTYDRTFADKHHVNVVGLYSAEQTTFNADKISARNIPNGDVFLYYNLARAAVENIKLDADDFKYWQSGLISWMGRVMYTYDDKYMISAAIRSDGSSRLAPGHKWHTYPAVSAGWNIHKENFMSGTKGWLDELKLRVGYGETSNQAIDPYATLGSLASQYYNFGNTLAVGYAYKSLPNDKLGWEYSKTWNFGVDFSFFGGRLTGTAEYYTQKTENVLLELKLPYTTGVEKTVANVGSTQNKGFEFSLNGTILEKRDFKWDAGFNFYFNRNKLTSLVTSHDADDTGNRWFIGKPLNCIYDFEYDGLWNDGDKYMNVLQPGAGFGDIKVKYHGEYDDTGKPVRSISDLDKVPISTEADFMGGFHTTLYYKNFDFSVIGSFQHGGVLISTIHNNNGYLNMLTGLRGQINVDYWTPDNTNARYPRPGGLNSNDNPIYGSTLGYFDASYLKLRTITLGYNLGKIKAVKKLGIHSLRVYATVQNPLVLFSPYTNECGLDPETNSTGDDIADKKTVATNDSLSEKYKVVGYNTPNTRNYLFGLNITF
ncbi:MAG: TonB-dependent receptor [Bacteroidales bacterium]|nr:TonB-dependent receptor [Bacteroidales bacterium]